MIRPKLTLLTAISIAATFTLTSCATTQLAQLSANKEGEQQKADLESVCTQIRLEGPAKDQSLFNARYLYAQSLQASVKSEIEQTTSIIGRDAQLNYTQKATETAEQTVSRAFPYATKTAFDGKYYKVYILMVINPENVIIR